MIKFLILTCYFNGTFPKGHVDVWRQKSKSIYLFTEEYLLNKQ